MACKGFICKQIAVLGVAIRDWNDDPDLMRCSTCDIIVHKKDWVVTKIERKVCPCCKLQLKANSRGKRAREKRAENYWKKNEQVEQIKTK